MGFFREVIEYYKDNPEGYWFKRKLFGWGGTPVRWQGWVVTLVAAAAVILLALRLEKQTDPNLLVGFFLPLLIIVSVLVYFSRKHGESPKWQWGVPKKDTDLKD